MKIKTLFLALLCLSLPSTTYSEHIYWDCNNDCDISAGLDRNSRNEIFIDNASSNCLKFIPFTFNNPDSCDFSFKVRLRDGDEIDNASRLLSPSAPSAEFGIVWDYIDSDNYSSAIFKRNTNNHFDEITRKDCFHVAIQVVSNGEKSIVKESDIDSKMAFEPNRYNTFQIKVDKNKCVSCGKCAKACKMDVDVTKAPNHTECIRCGMCIRTCPTGAVRFRYGFGDGKDKTKAAKKAAEKQ